MFENKLKDSILDFFQETLEIETSIDIVLSKTKKEFEGDFTFVVFPFLKLVKAKPEDLAARIGNYLETNLDFVKSYNVVKGFLNVSIKDKYWKIYSLDFNLDNTFEKTKNPKKIMLEFSSPNTNKPLHLGHIRNNLLGMSISNILDYTSDTVEKVSLLNDRGIHICKTMLAWEKWGEGITPEKAEKKGDHLIGDFYVEFENKYQDELKELESSGLSTEEAKAQSTLMKATQKMLKKWEHKNKKVHETWELLNSWVLKGFDDTYKKLGVSFDKIYFESETYLKGKDIIMRELSKGSVKINEDESVSIDLTDVGLDEKILLRSDGTTVYITQDIGTAVDRYNEYKFDKHYYVVGNEQIYHFKVLKEILKKFGYDWYDRIEHFSYGMVELPDGKMKSREGKVVDADDLIDEMIATAKAKANELGKLDANDPDYEDIIFKIAMGALKYFILKVDPKKNMMFNPEESIDFNGNTGPFIQYTYTRINSLKKKSEESGIKLNIDVSKDISLNSKELKLIKELYDFKNVVKEAANSLNPASIANFVYDLAKSFNSYYQDTPIFKEENKDVKVFRLKLANNVAETIKKGLALLGIDVPERM